MSHELAELKFILIFFLLLLQLLEVRLLKGEGEVVVCRWRAVGFFPQVVQGEVVKLGGRWLISDLIILHYSNIYNNK